MATATEVNKITWIKNAAKLNFVRELTVDAHTRSGKIAAPEGYELFGYEMLPEDATRNARGKFNRKLYLRAKGDETLMTAPPNSSDPKTLSGKGRKSIVKKAAAK